MYQYFCHFWLLLPTLATLLCQKLPQIQRWKLQWAISSIINQSLLWPLNQTFSYSFGKEINRTVQNCRNEEIKLHQHRNYVEEKGWDVEQIPDLQVGNIPFIENIIDPTFKDASGNSFPVLKQLLPKYFGIYYCRFHDLAETIEIADVAQIKIVQQNCRRCL